MKLAVSYTKPFGKRERCPTPRPVSRLALTKSRSRRHTIAIEPTHARAGGAAADTRLQTPPDAVQTPSLPKLVVVPMLRALEERH